MATYSSILAWRISWTEEPGRLQSMGSPRVGHDLVTEQQNKKMKWVANSSHSNIMKRKESRFVKKFFLFSFLGLLWVLVSLDKMFMMKLRSEGRMLCHIGKNAERHNFHWKCLFPGHLHPAWMLLCRSSVFPTQLQETSRCYCHWLILSNRAWVEWGRRQAEL